MNLFESLGRQMTIDRIELDPDNEPSLYGAGLGDVALDERDSVAIAFSQIVADIERVLEAHGPAHTEEAFDLLDESSELIEAYPIQGSMLTALILGHSSYCPDCAHELNRRKADRS